MTYTLRNSKFSQKGRRRGVEEEVADENGLRSAMCPRQCWPLGKCQCPRRGRSGGGELPHLKPGCGVGRMKLSVWGAVARPSDDGSRVETLSLE